MAKKTETPETGDKMPSEDPAFTGWVSQPGAILLSDGEARKYWVVEENIALAGDIVDRTTLNGEDEDPSDKQQRRYLVVQSTRPFHYKLAQDKTVYTDGKPGELVFVNIRHGLLPLVKFTHGSSIPRVQIMGTEQVPFGNEAHTVWRFRTEIKDSGRRKIPITHQLSTGDGAPDKDDSDIPF